MTQRRKWLLTATAVVVVWFAAVLVFWALRPLHDSVPVGLDVNGAPVSQDVECTTLFDSHAIDAGALPVLEPPFEYTREACSAVQRDARLVFGIDVGVAVLALAAISLVAVRTRGRVDDGVLDRFGVPIAG